MKNLDTYFLLKGLKAGEIQSLEKLYKIYYAKLFFFAKKFDSATLGPDDFVQQTFLKLWEKRSQLKDDVLLDRQIFVICKNLILNHLKREAKTVGEIEEKLFPQENEAEDFEENTRRMQKVYQIIDKLPPKRKKIFLLHKIENLTYEEISQSLGISKKTIANHLYLAHLFIQKELFM
ncbi:RNA polymerase sigma factor [Leeuwenhoekiella sp. A16]|uniref:RNA polymerase sigma factor n=1 Tax=unclassified Leeuwenhoekiella TaxID=2615029 RepID=UPI003A80BEA5